MLIFSINREEFLKGLSRVQNIVERKNTVPILSNVLIDGTGDKLKMLATDMEVGISGFVEASVKSQGSVTLSARKLFEIVKELPAESSVTVQVKEDNVSEITCGSSSFELKGLPADDYPSLPAYEEGNFLTLNAENFKDMIKKTIYAASTDETRYNLTGVLFEMEEQEDGKGILRLVATDGHRMAKVEKGAEGNIRPGESVVIPRKSLNEVRKLLEEGDDEMVEVDFQKQHGVFRKNSIVLTTRLIDMSFPNWKQVVPEERVFVAEADRESMIHAIRRVSLLSSERSRAIKFAFTGGKVTIHINNPDLGTATETVPVTYDGDDVEVTFNARYMLDTLTSMNVETVELGLKDELSPCVISQKGQEDYISVIMPMRI